MDKAFLESRISARPRILGLKLLPLSLGHRLILERAESSFTRGQRSEDRGQTNSAPALTSDLWPLTPDPVDLILAVLICSMTFEENTAALDSPAFGKQIAKWVKGLRKLNFIDKLNDFRRYWYYGNLIPDYTITAEDQGEWSGTPWPQRLKITLMTNLHFTESEVLNRPLRMCWWDYLCFEELRGNVTVISDEIRSAEDSLFEQANKVAENLNPKCQQHLN